MDCYIFETWMCKSGLLSSVSNVTRIVQKELGVSLSLHLDTVPHKEEIDLSPLLTI